MCLCTQLCLFYVAYRRKEDYLCSNRDAFSKQNIFCSGLLFSLDLPSRIVLMFGASDIFFVFGNGNLKCSSIFNETVT